MQDAAPPGDEIDTRFRALGFRTLLAVDRGGRRVTFDEKIPLSAVHGAKRQHLLVF